MIYDLNDDNFNILVAKFYCGKYWTNEEIEIDLKRIKYIKRLIGKYVKRGDLNERLILNHVIVLSNVFGPEFATKMLFFKLDKSYHSILKTFLLFLDFLPDYISSVAGETINTRLIPINQEVANRLREI